MCGAGTAGLAAAAALRTTGVDVIVLERTDQVGASWRTRYDGLRLNTPSWMSTQPGYRASRRRYGEFPSRDAWIQYLEDYAAHHRIDVRFGTQARRLASVNRGWRVETDRGDLQARFVVIATGFDHDPYLPDWPGHEGFGGELIHSSAFRSPEPYRDRDVLVVGPNTTGSERASFGEGTVLQRLQVRSKRPVAAHASRRSLDRSLSEETEALGDLLQAENNCAEALLLYQLFGPIRIGLAGAPQPVPPVLRHSSACTCVPSHTNTARCVPAARRGHHHHHRMQLGQRADFAPARCPPQGRSPRRTRRVAPLGAVLRTAGDPFRFLRVGGEPRSSGSTHPDYPDRQLATASARARPRSGLAGTRRSRSALPPEAVSGSDSQADRPRPAGGLARSDIPDVRFGADRSSRDRRPAWPDQALRRKPRERPGHRRSPSALEPGWRRSADLQPSLLAALRKPPRLRRDRRP